MVVLKTREVDFSSSYVGFGGGNVAMKSVLSCLLLSSFVSLSCGFSAVEAYESYHVTSAVKARADLTAAEFRVSPVASSSSLMSRSVSGRRDALMGGLFGIVTSWSSPAVASVASGVDLKGSSSGGGGGGGATATTTTTTTTTAGSIETVDAVDSIIESDFIDGPQGIKYRIIQTGNKDEQVQRAQQVYTTYSLWTGGFPEQGGVLIDTNTGFLGRPLPVIVGVGRVVKGWDLMLLEMSNGEKRRVVIPPSMGYGTKGAGRTIPPDTTLYFDMQIVKMDPMPTLTPEQIQWLKENPI